MLQKIVLWGLLLPPKRGTYARYNWGKNIFENFEVGFLLE